MERATQIGSIGTAIPYHFIGPAPDSARTDSDGNVYVAMYGQGRVLVFNKNGIPIGQVLLPRRDEGQNLESTSLAIKPDTNDRYIVTNDVSPLGFKFPEKRDSNNRVRKFCGHRLP